MITLTREIDDMPSLPEVEKVLKEIESNICEVVARTGYSAELITVTDEGNCDVYNCEDGWKW